MIEQSGPDVIETWKRGPKIECRKCGATLQHVNRVKAASVFWAAAATFFAVFFGAGIVCGNLGFIAVAMVGTVAIPVAMLSTEYRLVGLGNDS